MAILHKNITVSSDIHNPKWLPDANNGDYAFKNEKGELESIDELLLPAALNFVDGSVAAPTTSTNDIYILSSGGSVNAGWGSVSLQDWVRYDGTAWNSLTPQKSTLCYDKTADSLMSFDGSAWAAIGGGASGGVLGITDSSGVYTYYSTIELALAAASSGDVIEQFTNILVSGTSTINLIDGVTWQMNGYEYKNNTSNDMVMFTIPTNTTVKFTFKNGTIVKTGGTLVDNTNNVIHGGNYTTSEIISESMTFEATNGRAYGGSASLIGGNFEGKGFESQGSSKNINVSVTGNTLITGADSRVYNSIFFSGGNYNYLQTGCRVYNSTFESAGSHGALLGSGDCEAHNCTFISSAGSGIQITGTTSSAFAKMFNCTAISTASNGILGSGYAEIHNSTAISSSSRAMFLSDNVKVNNCVGRTSASQGIYVNNACIVKNTVSITTFNATNGHALVGVGTGFEFIACHGEVVNASAYGLNTISTSNGKMAKNTFKGTTTFIGGGGTNSMSNTPDSYGNLIIG